MLDFIKKNSFILFYTFFLGLVPLVASSSISYWVILHEAEIHSYSLATCMGLVILSCLTMAFAFTPTTFVALLGGYFWGWASVVPLAISYFVASFIGYRAAGFIDGGNFMKNLLQQKPKAGELIEKLKQDEFKIILFARLSPVLPFAVTNVLFSFSKTKMRNFLTAGFIGMLPRTLLSVWLGSQAKEIKRLIEHPSEGAVSQFAFMGLILVSVFGLVWVAKKII